eukprot:6360212-Amphidinium_carterae.1
MGEKLHPQHSILISTSCTETAIALAALEYGRSKACSVQAGRPTDPRDPHLASACHLTSLHSAPQDAIRAVSASGRQAP